MLASVAEREECTRVLLECSASVDLQDEHDSSALILAAWGGSQECVAALLQQGADRELRDQLGNTALLRATKKGHLQCIGLLLQADADSSVCDNQGHNLLSASVLVECGDVYYWICYDREVNWAFERQSDYLECVQLIESNRLRYRGHLKHGDSSSDPKFGNAKDEGDLVHCVRMLLDAGVDVNGVDKNGMSALAHAAVRGRVECVRELLNTTGVAVNGVDMAAANTRTLRITPLMAAAETGQTECMCELLQREDVNVNTADEYGNTALIHATNNQHMGCVRRMLQVEGLLVNHATTQGFSALMLATRAGWTECVEEILQRGDIDVNAENLLGWNVVEIAAEHGCHESLQKILEHAEHRNLTLKHLSLALARATARGHALCVELLEKSGVRERSDILLPVEVDTEHTEEEEFAALFTETNPERRWAQRLRRMAPNLSLEEALMLGEKHQSSLEAALQEVSQPQAHMVGPVRVLEEELQPLPEVEGMWSSCWLTDPSLGPLRRRMGVGLSGGGTRAASAGLGQLRALSTFRRSPTADHENQHVSAIDMVGYLSAVSGGGWVAVPFTFLPSNQLGPLMHQVSKLSEKFHLWLGSVGSEGDVLRRNMRGEETNFDHSKLQVYRFRAFLDRKTVKDVLEEDYGVFLDSKVKELCGPLCRVFGTVYRMKQDQATARYQALLGVVLKAAKWPKSGVAVDGQSTVERDAEQLRMEFLYLVQLVNEAHNKVADAREASPDSARAISDFVTDCFTCATLCVVDDQGPQRQQRWVVLRQRLRAMQEQPELLHIKTSRFLGDPVMDRQNDLHPAAFTTQNLISRRNVGAGAIANFKVDLPTKWQGVVDRVDGIRNGTIRRRLLKWLGFDLSKFKLQLTADGPGEKLTTWARLMGTQFLRDVGLDQDQAFFFSQEMLDVSRVQGMARLAHCTAEEVRMVERAVATAGEQDDSQLDASFTLSQRQRPFLIVNALIYDKRQSISDSDPVFPVQYTPLYVMVANKECAARRDSRGDAQLVPPSLESDVLHIGGKLMAPFLYNCSHASQVATMSYDQAHRPLVKVQLPLDEEGATRFTLSHIMASTGAAPQRAWDNLWTKRWSCLVPGVLRRLFAFPEDPRMLEMFPRFTSWCHQKAMGGRQSESEQQLSHVRLHHTDGGVIENTGLPALLQRGCSRALLFVNTGSAVQVPRARRGVWEWLQRKEAPAASLYQETPEGLCPRWEVVNQVRVDDQIDVLFRDTLPDGFASYKSRSCMLSNTSSLEEWTEFLAGRCDCATIMSPVVGKLVALHSLADGDALAREKTEIERALEESVSALEGFLSVALPADPLQRAEAQRRRTKIERNARRWHWVTRMLLRWIQAQEAGDHQARREVEWKLLSNLDTPLNRVKLALAGRVLNGEECAASVRTNTSANTTFQVPGGRPVHITFVYNQLAPGFVQRVLASADTDSDVKEALGDREGRLWANAASVNPAHVPEPPANSELADFPMYDTFLQIRLSELQVNMLAAHSEYVVWRLLEERIRFQHELDLIAPGVLELEGERSDFIDLSDMLFGQDDLQVSG